MALEFYWGSGSPYSWRVLLALEYKGVPYESHVLQFSKQEHKSPQMLRMNPRGRVPVLRDADFVVYESLAISQIDNAQGRWRATLPRSYRRCSSTHSMKTWKR